MILELEVANLQATAVEMDEVVDGLETTQNTQVLVHEPMARFRDIATTWWDELSYILLQPLSWMFYMVSYPLGTQLYKNVWFD